MKRTNRSLTGSVLFDGSIIRQGYVRMNELQYKMNRKAPGSSVMSGIFWSVLSNRSNSVAVRGNIANALRAHFKWETYAISEITILPI